MKYLLPMFDLSWYASVFYLFLWVKLSVKKATRLSGFFIH